MVLRRFIQSYKDGVFSWRNPLMLLIYSMVTSILLLILQYSFESNWIFMIGIVVWVFTTGIISFVIIGLIATLQERKRLKVKAESDES